MRKQVFLVLALAALLCIAYAHETAAQSTLSSHTESGDNQLVERKFRKSRGKTLKKALYRLRKKGGKKRRVGRKVGGVRKFSVLRGKIYYTVWSRISGGKWIRRKVARKSRKGLQLKKITKSNRKCIFTIRRKARKVRRVCRKKYSGRVVKRTVRLSRRLAKTIRGVAGRRKKFGWYHRRLHVPSTRRLTRGRWAVYKKKKNVYLITRGKIHKRVLRLKRGSKLSLRLARLIGKVPRNGKIRVRGSGKRLHVLKIRKTGLISKRKIRITKKVRKTLRRLVRKPIVRIPRRGRFVRRGKEWHVYRKGLTGHYKKFRSVRGHKGRRIVARLIGPGLKTAHFRLKGTTLFFKTLTKDGKVIRKQIKILKRKTLKQIKKLTRRSYKRRAKIYKAGKKHVLRRGPRVHRHIWRLVHLRRGRKGRVFAVVKARKGYSAIYRYRRGNANKRHLSKLYGKIRKGVRVTVKGRGKRYFVVRVCGQKRTVKKFRLTPRKRRLLRAVINQKHVVLSKKLVIRNGKSRARVYKVVRKRYYRVGTLKGGKRKLALRRLVGKKRAKKVRKVIVKRIGKRFHVTVISRKGKKKTFKKKISNRLYKGLRTVLNYRGVRKLRKLRKAKNFWNKAKRTNLKRLLKRKIVFRRIGKNIYVGHTRGNKIITQRVKAKSPLGFRIRKSIHRLKKRQSVIVQRVKSRKGKSVLKVKIYKRHAYYDTVRRKLSKKLKRALRLVLKKRKRVSYKHLRITRKAGKRCFKIQRKALGKFVHFKKVCGRKNKRRLRKLLGKKKVRVARVLLKRRKVVLWGKTRSGRRFKAIRKYTKKVHRRVRKTLYKKRPIKFGLSPGQKVKKSVLRGKAVLRKSKTHIYGSQRRKGGKVIFRIRRGTRFAKRLRKAFGKIPRKGKLVLIGLRKKVKVIRVSKKKGKKVKVIRASRRVRRILRRLSRQVGYKVGTIRFRKVGKRFYKLYRKTKRGYKLSSVIKGKKARQFRRWVGRKLVKGVIKTRGRKAIIRGRTKKGKYVRKIKPAKGRFLVLGGRKLRLRRHRIRSYKVGKFLYVYVFDTKGNRVFHGIRRNSKFGKRLVRAFGLHHFKNVIQGRQKRRGHVVVKAFHGHVWSKKKVRLSKKRAQVLRRLFKKKGIFIPHITKFKTGKRSIRLSKKTYGRYRVFKKISKKRAAKSLKFLKGLRRGTIRIVGKHITIIGKTRIGSIKQRKRTVKRRHLRRLFGKLRRRSKHSKKTRKNLRRKAGIPSRKVRKLLRRIRKLKRRIAKAKRARRKRAVRRLVRKLRRLSKRIRSIRKTYKVVRKLRKGKKARKCRKSKKGKRSKKLRRALKRLRRAIKKARKAKKSKKVRRLRKQLRRLLKKIKRAKRKGGKRGAKKLRRAIKKLRRAIKKARRAKQSKKVRRLKKKLRRLLKKIKRSKRKGGKRGSKKLRRAIKKLRRAIKKARKAKKSKKVRRLKKKLRSLLKKLKRAKRL